MARLKFQRAKLALAQANLLRRTGPPDDQFSATGLHVIESEITVTGRGKFKLTDGRRVILSPGSRQNGGRDLEGAITGRDVQVLALALANRSDE